MNRTPRPILFGVMAIPAATLLLEILVSRFFSVLFYYHYSFFAITIVMTGIALGGLLSAIRLRGHQRDWHRVRRELSGSAFVFSSAAAAATLFLVGFTPYVNFAIPTWWQIGLLALAYLPALVASGYFLATVFSAYSKDISRLYAFDLLAAGAAVACAVLIMRTWQGPVAAFLPALLGALTAYATSRAMVWRVPCAILVVATAIPVAMAPFWSGPLLKLPRASGVVFEKPEEFPLRVDRWNEHSRITVVGTDKGPINIAYIDKAAATELLPLPPRPPGGPPQTAPWLLSGIEALSYRLGRPHDRVAIIGIGGGRDLMNAAASGAKEIHGYELNRIFIDLLNNEFLNYTGGIAKYPEITLHHNEGRVGIRNSGRTYDVILASMIDTWAATANGGFVLSENGLYTVDGWRDFLGALNPRGYLTMTRWYLPRDPAETHRLIALASAALESVGIEDPTKHIILFTNGSPKQIAEATADAHLMCTIIVSKTAFSPEEIAQFNATLKGAWVEHTMLFPGPDPDPMLVQLATPATRADAIRASRFDITVPTDERPYFFLQLRPRQIFELFWDQRAGLQEIMFNGVRVLMVMSVASLVFAALIAGLCFATFRPEPGAQGDPVMGRLMTVYFFGIGAGFILVQLGLLQRLILVLGHPVYAFTVILFTMLLATGIGASISGRIRDKRMGTALLTVVLGLLALYVGFPLLRYVADIGWAPARIAAAGVAPAVAGLLLGLCFPLGIRIVSEAGESAVQRMWAINGAATVLGSCSAALLGLIGGSRFVVGGGVLLYAIVYFVGSIAASRHVSRARAREAASATAAPAATTPAPESPQQPSAS